MSGDAAWPLVAGTLQGLVFVVVFILAFLIGLCLLLGLVKLRRSGSRDAARSLDELVGEARHARFLSPDDPRGVVDQLNTPELLESAARKSG